MAYPLRTASDEQVSHDRVTIPRVATLIEQAILDAFERHRPVAVARLMDALSARHGTTRAKLQAEVARRLRGRALLAAEEAVPDVLVPPPRRDADGAPLPYGTPVSTVPTGVGKRLGRWASVFPFTGAAPAAELAAKRFGVDEDRFRDTLIGTLERRASGGRP